MKAGNCIRIPACLLALGTVKNCTEITTTPSSAAQGFLAQGANCAWYGNAQASLGAATQQADLERQRHQVECLRIETTILGALNAGNLAAAQGLLGQATSIGCAVSADTQQAVQWSLQMQQRQARDFTQQQALAQFAQNWQRLLQGMQPQPSPRPPPSVQPPSVQPPSMQLSATQGPAVPPRPESAPPPQTSKPLGYYEPRGTGSSCAAMLNSLDAQCTRMNKETETRKCQLERGRLGCALDYPGCGSGVLVDVFHENACTLHPSYPPRAPPIAQRYLQEVRGSVDRFFADRQAGAYQRGYACTQEAAQRARQAAAASFVLACEARCAQDGGRRHPLTTNYCNCERAGGRP